MDLRRRTYLFRLSHLYIPMAHSYSMAIHRRILELLEKGDKKEVEELVREHMLIAMDRFHRSETGKAREWHCGWSGPLWRFEMTIGMDKFQGLRVVGGR